ncbi:MAG TPA: hypothetical protein VFO76_06700 [Candidatus Kapabacteria bacterium]|nr:hypothetical protein [Candidatus Kapabacteria bacterium]
MNLSNTAQGQIEIYDILGRKLDGAAFACTDGGQIKFKFDAMQYPPQSYICKAKIYFDDGTQQEEVIQLLGVR